MMFEPGVGSGMPDAARRCTSVGWELRGLLIEQERELVGQVRGAAGLCVMTGGQTGVDTAAAQAALAAGLAVHLVFPRGFRQEDGPITDLRRRQLRGARLHELASAEFRYRTWTVVYLSDAVVLLDPAGGDGCQETARAAERLGRPLLRPGPGPVSGPELAAWLDDAGARVLAIAGCRASLLAESGTSDGVRAQVEQIVAGARLRHVQLVASSQDVAAAERISAGLSEPGPGSGR